MVSLEELMPSKFFLSGSLMNVFVNSQSSETNENNVDKLQGSSPSHTLFLIFINNLSGIFKSFVIIYADRLPKTKLIRVLQLNFPLTLL